MIKFPGFNLSLEVRQIAFSIFGIDIYCYAICICLGVILALVLCRFSKEKFGIEFDFLFETLIYAVLIGIVGARIYYVIFKLDYYLLKPVEILKIRDGGLAIYGGLIAGGIFILARCNKYKVDKLDFFDYLAPSVALAQSIGRWGNFFNQEAYGTMTKNIFRMGIITEKGYTEVHPTFLYESISTLVIFAILKILQKNRKFKGEIFYWYLIMYSGIRMVIENLRIDSLMLKKFRISQILSVAIFVVFSMLLLKKYIKYIKPQKNSIKLKKKVNENNLQM